MNRTGKLFLGFSIFLSSVLPSHAQLPVILAPVAEAPSGTTYTAHIKTIDFTGITGLQFIISWDYVLRGDRSPLNRTWSRFSPPVLQNKQPNN